MKEHVQDSTSQTIEPISVRSTVDLLNLLWRRKALVCVGIIIGIVAGTVYYFTAKPEYESSAEVLVVSKRPEVVSTDQGYESHFEDYVATHRALIASRLILERAIETADLGSLYMFSWVELQDEYDMVDVIQWDLDVGGGARELGESADSIMTLAFRGRNFEECPVVVQAVVDSYKSFLDETYRGMSDDTMELISQARELLQNDLQTQEEAYSQFRQRSPLVTRGTDEVNPLEDRLTAIETERSELLIRRAEVEGQLKAIQQAEADGIDRQQLLALVSNLRYRSTPDGSGQTPSTTLENQLVTLADTEKSLLEHYGPSHPHVATIRERIAATRHLQALPTMAHMQASESPLEPDNGTTDFDPVKLYGEYLEQELKGIRISEDLLTTLYEDARESAKELTSYELTDERLQRNIERTQQLYDGLISQLQDASLIKDYGGFDARVIAPPMLGEQVSPNERIVIPAALLGGMVLGFCLAIWAEIADESFHSPEEIQAELELPIVGHIPRFSAVTESAQRAAAGAVPLHPTLCTYFEPRSRQTEAYRAVRTALFIADRDETHRVIQVTGLSPNDGASTLAANLAISMAQTGKRVLLIDADLRRPRQHEIFGISPPTGLGSLVELDDQLNEAICSTVVDNLWLLPAGPLPPDPSELFTSPRFPELIDRVGQRFEYVLIDTGPLLAVSEPRIIATRTDGVLLTLRLTKDSRPRAGQAREKLDTIDAKLLGVVANGVGGADARGYQFELADSYHQTPDSANGRSRSRAKELQEAGT